MADISLFEEAKELEAHVTRLLTAHDITNMPHIQKELVNTIRLQMVDMRLDVRDFEYAQSRAEQQEYATEAHPRLEELQRSILKASEYGLLGAIDIAHVSAQLQQLLSHIR